LKPDSETTRAKGENRKADHRMLQHAFLKLIVNNNAKSRKAFLFFEGHVPMYIQRHLLRKVRERRRGWDPTTRCPSRATFAALSESQISSHSQYTEDNSDNKQHRRLQYIREYCRDYYKKNRQKQLHYNHAHYKKNRDTRLQQVLEYNQKNKDKISEYRQKNSERNSKYYQTYYQKNYEKIRETRKKNREKNREQTKQYFQEYREKNREKIREYNKKNREKILVQQREYRCRKSQARGLPLPKKYSSWKSVDEVRNFFRTFSELHFIKSWPEDWYRVSVQQVELAGGMPPRSSPLPLPFPPRPRPPLHLLSLLSLVLLVLLIHASSSSSLSSLPSLLVILTQKRSKHHKQI
jgi:hypothetical protein